MMTTTPTTPYRSRAWFDTPELYGWLRRAAFKAAGFGEPAYEGRPIIGICNTWSQRPRHSCRGLSLATAPSCPAASTDWARTSNDSC